MGIGVLVGLVVTLSFYWTREHTATAPRLQEEAPSAAASAQWLTFEPEAGAETSRFITRVDRYAIRLHPGGAQISLTPAQGGRKGPESISLSLVASNQSAAGAGAGGIRGWSHYYLGSEPSAWRAHVPNYPRVEYADVYPGIDLVWHGERGGLEFDFVIAPGADPGRIGLNFDAIQSMQIDQAGRLVLETPGGALTLQRPLAYQERAGRRETVSVAYELTGMDDAVRFRTGKYDPSRRLIIDPVISYADYLGGSEDDAGLAIAVDAAGNRYVAGNTVSIDFPGNGKPLNTGTDAFIVKLAPDGTREYITYIGAVGTDVANAISVDDDGRAHVAGDTDSPLMPATTGAMQPVYGGGGDGFVARLTDDGTLDYLTYLGGSGLDSARAIALGSLGDMYVGGSTLSSDFPVEGSPPLQATLKGEGDGFITRIDAGGSFPVFSTYLGGNGGDNVWAIALDDAGAVYVGGATSSENFPPEGSLGSFRETYQGGSSDGYVAKLGADGAGLEYSSYLGGANTDRVLALAVDGDRNAYVTGITASTDFPILDGVIYGGGSFDAFVTRFVANGSSVDYSRYLGGNGEDQGLSIALVNDDQNVGPIQAVIVGTTQSSNLALAQPLQVQRLGGRDGFLIQVQFGAQSAITLPFSTYLGGTGDDVLTGVAVDASDGLNVAGTVASRNLPAVAATQGQKAGKVDAYVLRIDRSGTQLLPDLRVDIEADPQPVTHRNDLFYNIVVGNEGAGSASGVMVLVDGTNLLSLGSPDTGCESVGGIAVLCAGGNVGSGDTGSFEIRAEPDEIGPTTLTATLVRADQSGISVANNSASVDRLVVDDSDQSAGLSWEVLAAIAMLPLLWRRRYPRAADPVR